MKNSIILIVALITVVIGALISFDWELFQIDPDLFSNGTSIFLKYGIIIIAVERAAQVYLGVRYEPTKRSIKTEISNIDDRIYHYNSDIEKVGDDTNHLQNLVGKRESLNTEKANINIRLSDHRNKVQKVALRVVFFAGIILAICGLSILSDMVYTPDSWVDCNAGKCRLQIYLFRAIDILITGGLIGGGSKSFHQFLSNIDRYVETKKP